MRLPGTRLLAATGAVLLGACAPGCAHRVTPEMRRISFEPHATATIGGRPVAEFLLARTAILMTGTDANAAGEPASAPSAPELELAPREGLGFGTATAIDPRGYLLTASHCVGRGPVYLVFSSPRAHPRIERARVVWQGDFARNEPDLALLRIVHRLDATLEWAADFKPGDPVFAAGLNYDQTFHFDSGCVAGEVTRIAHHAETAFPHDHVFHQAPLHSGDSGGPLTTTAGRLIGINTGTGSLQVWPFSWRVSRAERPDLAWLRRLIETDYAAP